MSIYSIAFDILSLPKVQKAVKIGLYNTPYLGTVLKLYDIIF